MATLTQQFSPEAWLLPAAEGRKILYTPQDGYWLTEPLCILRAQIEVFAARPDDIEQCYRVSRAGWWGTRRSLVVGRVGIRCIHCAHLPLKDRSRGAVSYPNSIRLVHQAVRNFQRYHFMDCGYIPTSVRQRFDAFRRKRALSKKNSNEYWVSCCERMGLADCNDAAADTDGEGIRFKDENAAKLMPGDDSSRSPEVETKQIAGGEIARGSFKKWRCSACNQKDVFFVTFVEACAHEEMCTRINGTVSTARFFPDGLICREEKIPSIMRNEPCHSEKEKTYVPNRNFDDLLEKGVVTDQDGGTAEPWVAGAHTLGEGASIMPSANNPLLECPICGENYCPAIDGCYPVLMKCCGNSICLVCVEKDRASKADGLLGRRKTIPCMMCNVRYHSEEETPYVPNRKFAELLEKGVITDQNDGTAAPSVEGEQANSISVKVKAKADFDADANAAPAFLAENEDGYISPIQKSFLNLEASGHQSCDSDSDSDSDESRSSSSATGGKKNSSLKGKSLVQHNYHDHANVKCKLNMFVTRGGMNFVFPVKLFRMLLNTEADGQTDIFGWQPHGRSFAVRKPKEFAEQILPKFFGKMKYASFQRQLNLYGFLRLSRGQDKGSYYHELFLRHRDFLCYKIQRTRIKGNGSRAASNPSAEPDFYGMPPVAERVAEQQQVAAAPF